jgi:hypothetical protein
MGSERCREFYVAPWRPMAPHLAPNKRQTAQMPAPGAVRSVGLRGGERPHAPSDITLRDREVRGERARSRRSERSRREALVACWSHITGSSLRRPEVGGGDSSQKSTKRILTRNGAASRPHPGCRWPSMTSHVLTPHRGLVQSLRAAGVPISRPRPSLSFG